MDLAFLLANFTTFRGCTSLYKLAQAGTSPEKFFVGLLMHLLFDLYFVSQIHVRHDFVDSYSSDHCALFLCI
jgi:hypothetical protein